MRLDLRHRHRCDAVGRRLAVLVLACGAVLAACGPSAAAPAAPVVPTTHNGSGAPTSAAAPPPTAAAQPTAAPAAPTALPAAPTTVLAAPTAAGSAATRPTVLPAAAPAPTPGASANAVDFVYGVSTVTPELLPVWAAQDQGFDLKYGLKFNVVSTEGGSKGLLVLVGGNFQAMDVGLAPSIIANSHGADVRIVDSIANSIPFILFGGKGITSANAAEALKGSKIGISAFGSESDIAATLFLNRLGLARDKDVTVVQVGGGGTRLAALESGAVGAVPLLGAEALKAQDDGFEALLDLSANSDWVFEASVLNKSFIEAHRDQALGLARALIEGNYYSRAKPADAKRILAAGLSITDNRLIDASYDEYARVVPIDLTPRQAGIAEVLAQVKALPDTTLSTDDPSAYIDLSLLDQLRAEGFFDSMQKTYNVH